MLLGGGRLLATASSSSLWWVGVLLDAVATLAGTAGKQLLRHASVTKKMRYYPMGLVCTAVIDPAFDISAYSFAAQSIIAPCAGMVVVWNVLLAPFTLDERLTFSRKVGAFLICAGTICVGLFGNHEEVDRTVDEYIELFARPAACIYYALFFVWSVGCLYFYVAGSGVISGACHSSLRLFCRRRLRRITCGEHVSRQSLHRDDLVPELFLQVSVRHMAATKL
eukprot:334602-Pleurochrysis_carterae.AAC.1